ncbi:hypothetical protein [Pseudodonghicola xiamenensis]|uniref:DUF2157 domain-containing protein n=2 Tax=Pseudodonghicola xiamenensis TaxID=337702 RepID=A0A8J3MGC4_9RHOB|nr:hypothetical protein [Pseudodonghicola xiamenensis]GHH00042.1 hypothetical protein GCM10010961_36460 [Pseudodonghicola xiamenensis]
MKYVIDIDELLADGVIAADQGREIARRAREGMIASAINFLLFCGILAVIAGMAAYVSDAGQLSVLGGGVTVVAGLALFWGRENTRLLANATAVIGAVMLVGGGAVWLVGDNGGELRAAVAGGAVALAGYALWRWGATRLRLLAGWLCVLGLVVHLGGLLLASDSGVPQWLLYHYAGGMLILCGVALDIRVVSALAILPLGAALSARSFAESSAGAMAIHESALTIVQMASLVGLCLWAMRHCGGRVGRHAGGLGSLAFVWMNVAFWVGSVWGDVVGATLWGPQWPDFAAQSYSLAPDSPRQSFRDAQAVFEAGALHLSAGLFAAVWALVLSAAGLWSAMGARRMVFNTVLTFATLHLYSQYFMRIDTTPGTVVIAGLIAIAIAYVAWQLNGRLAARQRRAGEMGGQGIEPRRGP